MNTVHYLCTGSCHADISEKQYNAGLMVCGNNACEKKEQPFEKVTICDVCKKTIQEKETHQHM